MSIDRQKTFLSIDFGIASHRNEVHTPVEDEGQIWEQFKSGNQNALSYIYRNYSNFLFNYGCQFTADRALVKDCLQDLFLELIKKQKRLSSTTSIRFYLMKSFRNKVVKTLKDQQKRQMTESEGEKQESLFRVSLSPEAKMINSQMDSDQQQIIEEKLNELPPLQREALLLYFYEGLKYDQIAELLGIQVKSTRALIYRSLQSLGDLLSPLRNTILLLSVLFSF